ncbi:hypothetical protein KDW54_06910 [Burkholderia ambifaria]|uniref:hypothetical protein n=1 Tax=Burkholderia ambifaria TaxID=152480 RepID=UPI001B964573|nr:hypothetical protein [Burkholderia ambifaria]MBR8182126.1 hypothetical protein [Burkholderia ambifaria]
MFETDFDQFVAMLDATYSLHGKTLPGIAKAMFFRAMSAYSLNTVRAAIDGHVKDSQRGQFPPKPADLIAQIEGHAANDSRPGPEEAWAIAVQAFDEAVTVVMTDEIAEAMSIARPVFELGDEVGARMAFKESYGRLVTQARSAGMAAKWFPSLGYDAGQRAEVLDRAISRGLLSHEVPTIVGALPAPADGVPLLEAAIAASDKPDARATLDALHKFLNRDSEEEERQRLALVRHQIDATNTRKAELQRQTDSLVGRAA